MILGIGLSLASYFLDDRLKRVEDLEQAVGMSVLSVIPPVSSPKAGDRARVVEQDPHAPSSEAFRSLRASLVLRPEWQQCRRIMVTSTTAGEGKSLVASNLAIVLAQDGKKTLLIDGDMRRPTAQAVFKDTATVGLSDVLRMQCRVEQAVSPTAIPGLSVMTAGAMPDSPSEAGGAAGAGASAGAAGPPPSAAWSGGPSAAGAAARSTPASTA